MGARKMVYIAGPYTAPTKCGIAANVQAAREVADAVNRLGFVAITPHLLGDGIEDSGDEAFWYEGTLELMRRCDAVVMTLMWASSKGARNEKEEALRLGLPVFFSMCGDWREELQKWGAGEMPEAVAGKTPLADALRSIESVGRQILLLSRGVDFVEKINEESGDGYPPSIGEKMRVLVAACLGVDPSMLRPPPIDLNSRPTRD